MTDLIHFPALVNAACKAWCFRVKGPRTLDCSFALQLNIIGATERERERERDRERDRERRQFRIVHQTTNGCLGQTWLRGRKERGKLAKRERERERSKGTGDGKKGERERMRNTDGRAEREQRERGDSNTQKRRNVRTKSSKPYLLHRMNEQAEKENHTE